MPGGARVATERAPRALGGRVGGHGPAVVRALGRDLGPYSARNTSKGALLAEARAVFLALGEGLSLAEVREKCLFGKVLRQRARETRRHIWDALHWRFFIWEPPDWVVSDLARAAAGVTSPAGFAAMAYLHYARRDRLTFDFVTHKLWALSRAGAVVVGRNDVLDFLAQAPDLRVKRWRESTRIKLAGNVLSALRDFGLFAGVQRKRLQRPPVAPDAVLHLCRLLQAEGHRGRSVLESADWRLFLWDQDATAQALGQLAQRGQVRFERSGRSVVLEIPEPPGSQE